QRDVRMERAEFRIQSGGEQRVVDVFVKREQMWMAGANARPQDARPFSTERAGAFNWQEKRRDLDLRQLRVQPVFLFRRDISQKSQGQVKLLRRKPATATERPLQGRERLTAVFRKLQRDEQAFHF